MRQLVLLLSMTLLLAACTHRPKGMLSEKEMADLLADLEMAEAYYNTSVGDDYIDKETLRRSVLKQHGVTPEELDSIQAYYGRNMDEYSKLYDKVAENIRKRSQSGSPALNEGDNLWPYPSFAPVMANQATDGIVFSFPADKLEKGNSISWKMRLSSADGVETNLGVEYDDGSVTMARRKNVTDRTLEVELQTDTGKQAVRIFGNLTVPQRSKPLWADSIRMTRNDYDSLTYSSIYQQFNIR